MSHHLLSASSSLWLVMAETAAIAVLLAVKNSGRTLTQPLRRQEKNHG